MKISKLFAITLQSKSGLVFFAVLSAYNLLLGVYLKDFLVLSPVLLTFYLLSVLPTLFFGLKIRSTPMRAVVLIVLFFVMLMSIVSALSCRRVLPMLTFVVTAIEMMYFGIVDNSSGKDKLLTKFVPVVKPTRKRHERFMIGSYPTLSTTTTAIHSSNTLMFARHCKPSKGFALILLTYSPHSAVVKISLAMPLTEYPVRTAQIGTLGTACTITALGGMWI